LKCIAPLSAIRTVWCSEVGQHAKNYRSVQRTEAGTQDVICLVYRKYRLLFDIYGEKDREIEGEREREREGDEEIIRE